MTADCEWSPTLLDNIIGDGDSWITDANHVNPGHNKSFDHFADYQKRTISTHNTSGNPHPTAQVDVESFYETIDPPDPIVFDVDSFFYHGHDENI